MGREALTWIILIGIKIDLDRDPRLVAKESKEKLGAKVRHERGQKPRPGHDVSPSKVEIELIVHGKDLALTLINVCSVYQMAPILDAVGASYEDILYLEADRAR